MTGSEDTPLKTIKDGIGLGTVADGPESRRGEGGSNETLYTLNVDTCTTVSQTSRNRAISSDSDVVVGQGG